MSQSQWAQVIEYLYRNEGYYHYPEDTYKESELQKFAEKEQFTLTDFRQFGGDMFLKTTGIEKAINEDSLWRFLERTNLIRAEVRDDGVAIILTEDGFDVAHERELRQEQQSLMETQSEATGTLANFTAILGAAALVQALAAVVTAQRYTYLLAIVYLIILALLLYKIDGWKY